MGSNRRRCATCVTAHNGVHPRSNDLRERQVIISFKPRQLNARWRAKTNLGNRALFFFFFLFTIFVFSLNNLPCGRPWICHYGKRCFRGFVGIGCDTLDRRKLFLFVLNRDVFI